MQHILNKKYRVQLYLTTNISKTINIYNVCISLLDNDSSNVIDFNLREKV